MKVSIILPTYNAEPFIAQTIRSILYQTYKQWELIIVDDASKDRTIEIIKQFISQDNRIKLIILNQNSGAPARPRNIGIKNASGDIICFIDHDDEWLPSKLEKQVKIFKTASKNVGVVYCGYYGVYRGKVVYEKRPKLRGYVFYDVLKNCPVGLLTCSVKTECFKKVGGFDESLKNCDDWDMWIRIAKYYEFDFIDETLALHYIHKHQNSTILIRTIKDREIILKKYRKELLINRKIFSWHLRRLGSLYCLSQDHNKGRIYLLRSIAVYPINIGSYIHIILSFISTYLHSKAIIKFGITKVNNILLID